MLRMVYSSTYILTTALTIPIDHIISGIDYGYSCTHSRVGQNIQAPISLP